MNTAVINFKTDPLVKKRAQKRAKQLGLSLSGVMNSHLREFITGKNFHVELEKEEPSEYLIQALKESEADRKAGRVYSFDSIDASLPFLQSLRNDK